MLSSILVAAYAKPTGIFVVRCCVDEEVGSGEKTAASGKHCCSEVRNGAFHITRNCVELCLWHRSPTEPGSYMIKRVIATEGERVR